MSNQIHPTAIVSEQAKLGTGNTVGPYAIIEAGAELGDNNRIAAHAVIKAGARLKDANTVFEQAVIGGIPQHLGHDESRPTYLKIGSNNVFRENVTINCAWKDEFTVLGDKNFLMHAVHIGHDCVIGNEVVIGPATGIGGHVHIKNKAIISGGVMVHQFAQIGRFAMIGGNTKVTQDVLPFMIVDGNPATVRGLNTIGLKRNGFTHSDLKVLKQAYQTLFYGGSLKGNLEAIQALNSEYTSELCDFINQSERGFHRIK